MRRCRYQKRAGCFLKWRYGWGEQEKDMPIDPGPFWRRGVADEPDSGVPHFPEVLQLLLTDFLQTPYCLSANSHQFVSHY